MGAPNAEKFPLRHIAIEGPIGVGKTSLAGLLAKRFSGTQFLEDVKNPFLPDFYEGKKGAAFQAQIYFLLSRYGQQQEIAQMDLFKELVIADYTFAKDKIFANLTLSDEEMRLYEKVWQPLSEALPKPDLVIHLTATVETCLSRIKLRGRSFEKSITADYLKQLTEAYNYFFHHYRETPLLVVDTNQIDFVKRKDDLEDLIRQITRPFRGTQFYVPRGSR
ncbi:MAG TPA: deoxynucleoside kinase [Thermoanaerobaculia bacterium]|nr:deoxynucleoside kinase [Thermoanaerobaculia bacterium]